jgi:chromosome segregation ATPase
MPPLGWKRSGVATQGKATKASSVKNKSAAASPAKKAAASPAKKVAKKQEDFEDHEEETQPQKTEQQEFKSAEGEVGKKKREIGRLEAARDALAEKLKEKMKDYNKQIKAAEKELEALQEKAKEKGKAAHKVKKIADMAKAAHLAAKLEETANKVAARRLLASKALKAAKERKEQLSAKLSAKQAKADEFKVAFNRAQAAYDSAVKQCKQLKAAGEYVPEEGWKDYSAPFAYKPPGVRAFLDLQGAKEKFAKAKAVWEKHSEEIQRKEEMAQAAVSKLKEVAAQRKAVEEKKEELDSKLTGIAKKLKPKDKLRIKEAQGSLKKVIKIHKKK